MRAALDVARAPVIFSHSSALALCGNPRNVPDDVLKRLADNGGVCMVPFFVSQECDDWFSALKAEVSRRGLDPRDLGAVYGVKPEWEAAHPMPTATLVQVADHVERVRSVADIEHYRIEYPYGILLRRNYVSEGGNGLTDLVGIPGRQCSILAGGRLRAWAAIAP